MKRETLMTSAMKLSQEQPARMRGNLQRSCSSAPTLLRTEASELMHRYKGNQASQPAAAPEAARPVQNAPAITLQASLTVSRPDDPFEREAERVAEQVLRMPVPDLADEQQATGEVNQPVIHRLPASRSPRRGQSEVTPAIESQIRGLQGGGQPLPETTRAYFEPRFGYDFGDVRVHSDDRAANLAQSVSARAFTVGQDVVFGAGQYAPGSGAERRLLGHELTHVVQQRLAGKSFSLQRFWSLQVITTSITKELAEGLNDAELVEHIKVARSQLLSSTPGTPEHETIRLNLQVMTDVMTRRTRSLGELAVPPLPSATIILVGSITNNDTHPSYDKNPYNFVDAAIKTVPKIKSSFPGTRITILFFTPGYKLRGMDIYAEAMDRLSKTGNTVIEVTASGEVIDFLNTALVLPEQSIPTRAVKVSQFFYFGHGSSGALLLNWGWGQKDHKLDTNEITDIKTDAFEPTGRSYLFTCHIAEGEESFMATWAAHLGQSSIGSQGSAAYNAEYEALDLEKSINRRLPKWFLGLPYMNKVKIIDPESNSSH